MVFPMYWIVHVALSAPSDVFNYPPGFLPHPTLFGNFAHAAEGSIGVGSVLPFFRNSVMYAVLATAGCLIMQCIVGFGFARYEFPGRRILFVADGVDDDAPLRRHPDPALHHLPGPPSQQHALAADNPLVARRVAVRDIPDAPVLHEHPHGPRRGGPSRRDGRLAHPLDCSCRRRFRCSSPSA